jgi:hypothetical protein
MVRSVRRDRAGVLDRSVGQLRLFGFGERAEFAVLGTILWGIGMGAQVSIMRAAIADMTSPAQRATAYGRSIPSHA